MPRFLHFYSLTETEASTNVLKLFARKHTGESTYDKQNAQRLDGLLHGETISRVCRREDTNQPLFRLKPSAQSIELFLSESRFSLTEELVVRHKNTRDGTTSEDSPEWTVRSLTPSSDDRSPRKPQPLAPVSSNESGASNASDGPVYDLADTTRSEETDSQESPVKSPRYHATYAQSVLQSMDTQFSKWSYELREGQTAIPFVMARAPTGTHERLVETDRRLWVTGAKDDGADGTYDQITAQALLESTRYAQSSGSRGVNGAKLSASSEPKTEVNATSMSKRAALIAKNKATSLIVSKSANHKRAALQKNKARKSILSSPPPTLKEQEPAQKPESQTEHSGPTIVIMNPSVQNQRREVESALQNRMIDFTNRPQLEALMEHLSKTSEEPSVERIVEEVEEAEDNTGSTAKLTGRLKGKARKRAKTNATH